MGYIWWHDDTELFNAEIFDTLETCVSDAIEKNSTNERYVFVGETCPYKISIGGNSVIELAAEFTDQIVGADAENWISDIEAVPNDKIIELDEKMTNAFNDWLKKNGLEPTFQHIANIQKINLTEVKNDN